MVRWNFWDDLWTKQHNHFLRWIYVCVFFFFFRCRIHGGSSPKPRWWPSHLPSFPSGRAIFAVEFFNGRNPGKETAEPSEPVDLKLWGLGPGLNCMGRSNKQPFVWWLNLQCSAISSWTRSIPQESTARWWKKHILQKTLAVLLGRTKRSHSPDLFGSTPGVPQSWKEQTCRRTLEAEGKGRLLLHFVFFDVFLMILQDSAGTYIMYIMYRCSQWTRDICVPLVIFWANLRVRVR